MSFEEFKVDSLIKELEKMENIEQTALKMLNTAAPIVEEELKRRVAQEADKGYASGELKKSIEAKKAKKNEYGYYAYVTAEGVDKKGVRNNEKLAYLNYGTSKQMARPVITPTIKATEQKCLDKMQEVFDKEQK